MKMIEIATDSSFPVVCFGETLFDIIEGKQLPGGAPMNVAYHLHKLGLKPAIISKVGVDDLGDELLSILQSQGVTPEFIQKDLSRTTGKVFAEIKANHEVAYDMVKPVAWDFIEAAAGYKDLVSQSKYFVFGSLAARSQASKETLFKLLKFANTKVLDINLRAPHYNQPLITDLIKHANILKLNLAELELLGEWFGYSSDERECMKSLQNDFNLETVIVTKGGDGAAVLSGRSFYEHQGFKVKVADTVGSGDAFLAAYLAKHIENADGKESIEFACATGALIASYNGACPNYSVSSIRELIKSGN